jgi:hypothetical protein
MMIRMIKSRRKRKEGDVLVVVVVHLEYSQGIEAAQKAIVYFSDVLIMVQGKWWPDDLDHDEPT